MNQSPLELRHLRTLLALRDTGSLSRAAQLLCLTQSALSHQLKAIESHYGAALFARKSQPPAFSAAGQRLLELAEALLPAIDAAERDVFRLAGGSGGNLRIAVECHTCFDWLMPAMDRFRASWPAVELDIVSGFHTDPVGLLHGQRADLAIVSTDEDGDNADLLPLFSYDIVALLANDHPLAGKPWLDAADFAADTLITYPVPDEMLDVVRQVLRPAGISPARRSAELTVAILQLVASRRGIAALPAWAVQGFVDRHYVSARPITRAGLKGRLFAALRPGEAGLPYLREFVAIMRETSLINLPGISLS